jgi:very-short-patch-repair endonuclease
MPKKKTTEQFIMEAKLKHPGDVYDYSKVNYTGKDKPVTIICIKHGDFEQLANLHLRGSGCNTCGIERRCLLQRMGLGVFIERAKQIHGEDTYDYSMVEYINTKTKVIIICKIHKAFLQTPSSHIIGAGCKKCADINNGANRKFTKEQVIQMAIEVHGDTYDYSKAEYNNGIIQNIICKEVGHTPFSQFRHIHINLRGGCKPCADILRGKNRRYTKEQFIKMARDVHGDTYDYSKVEYTGIYDKIIIICKIHGEFPQVPSNHIRGAGCQQCYKERRGRDQRFTTEQIVKMARDVHGDTYDYSKVEYTGIDDKIIIICRVHDEFLQSPYCHINKKHGCKKCADILRGENRTFTTEQFVEKANIVHPNKYNYRETNYKKQNENVIIICQFHGRFSQQPNNHLNGQGCPFCVNKTEIKLYEQLVSIYPTLIMQFKQDWCKNIQYLRFDFCIPESKIIIELDGRQHFEQVSNWKTPEEQFIRDKYKEQCANDNGYSVIRLLQEDVFYDTYDWVKELRDTIEQIKSWNKITNIYLSKNDEYALY